MARLSNPKNVSFSPSCESGTIYSGIRLRRFSVPDPDPTPIILNVFGNFYIYTVLSIQNKDSTNLCHFVSVRQNFCKQWKQKRREQKSIIYLFLFARSGSETNNSRSGSRKKFPTQFFFFGMAIFHFQTIRLLLICLKNGRATCCILRKYFFSPSAHDILILFLSFFFVFTAPWA